MSALDGLYAHPHWPLIVEWFDPSGYLDIHEDLQAAGYTIREPERLTYHFLNQGFLERRIYRPQLVRSFDYDFYRAQRGARGQALNERELQQHWVYEGVFAGLAPTDVTQAALSSPFQVFNMGRVGSQAVVQALAGTGLTNVIHTHSDYEFGQSYAGSALTFSQLLQVKHFCAGSNPPRIISGVRDPIDWALSAIWRSASVGDQKLPRDVRSVLAHVRRTLGAGLNWFRHRYFVDLDVYEYPFDREAGFAIIEQGRTRVLLYRLDRLPHFRPALEEFTGVAGLALGTVDRSSGSAQRHRLETVLRIARLPEDLLNEIYESRYARHFFTPTARAEMRERWLAHAS